MRRLLLTFLLFGFFALVASAQGKTITGTVTDAGDGTPITGATVVEKGTTNGVISDENGKYSLRVSSANAIIQFSFIGMTSIERKADKSKLNVKLAASTINVGEVVVTAMGVSKAAKSLGYSSTVVKTDELNAAKSGSMMSGLTGKVAGMSVSSSGGTGTSQKVVVRGFSSFSNNQPLYIVDGTPIQNSFAGSQDASGNPGGSKNSVDFGNGAGDINPEDVESVTVLKGASATALYGSRAANGVIMITTKKAKKNQKPIITYSGAFTANQVARTPQTQDMFGQGWNDGTWLDGGDQGENGSWGHLLDGRNHIWGAPIDGVYREKPYSFVKNNLKNFYETGLDKSNNISLSTSGEHTGIRISFGNLTSDGVIPTDADKYVRNTFSFTGNTKYDKLNISYTINYAQKNINALAAGQGGNGASMSQELIQYPVDINYQDLKDLNNPYNNIDNYYTFYAENPYWVIANNGNNYKDNHTYGNINASYEILKGIKLVGKAGGDFTDSRQRRWNAVAKVSPGSYSYGIKQDEVGSYQEHNESLGQIDLTGMIQVDKDLNKDWNLSGILGTNYNQVQRYYSDALQYGLNIPNWYSLENGSQQPTSFSRFYTRRLIGLFGQATFGYKDYWFTNISVRNDWSSTLPKTNRSFLYWGVNSSLILTQLYPQIQSDKLSFLKVRLAYGKTGNDADWYLTNNTFEPVKIRLDFGELNLPLNQISGVTIGNRRGNQNLKPEITTEAELGIQSRFLNDRVSFDFTYYNRETVNQIIAAALPYETGYSTFTRNVGKIQNQGIEIALGLVPVKTKDWQWNFNTTFTTNKNMVKTLWQVDGVEQKEYVLQTAYDVDFVAEVGQPLGIFKIPELLKTADGKTIVNSAGLPVVDPNNKRTLGSSNPNFVMGFTNRVTWKNITLGTVFDWREGGYFFSNTARMLIWNGNATTTMFNDRQPFIVPNSVKNVGGNYVENDIPISNNYMNYYYNDTSNPGMYENFVLPKGFLKLRELSITYNLPSELLAKTFFREVQVSAIGRNLFMWTPTKNNYVDPEATNYGNDITSEFGEFNANPTMRSLGGSIKVVF